jgi:trans-2,3-dihydro-3-hydroxyanthranilate isomerase
MSTYQFLQFDVFTDRAFCGNPLAVFPEAEGISDEKMGQIAREMNLSETVFVLKHDSEDVLRRLRIFTPVREIPFAGHPIVGTWTALAQEGVVPLPMEETEPRASIMKSGSECCRLILSLKMDERSRS